MPAKRKSSDVPQLAGSASKPTKRKSSDVSQLADSATESDSYWHLFGFPKAKKTKTKDSMDSGVLQLTEPQVPSSASSSMDSPVLQPTDLQVRILFADAGCISSRLEKSLIKDERVHLQTDDLLDTAEIFDAPIIIGSN